MKPINDTHIARFAFAGFHWPRYVATLTPLAQLRKKSETRKVCGGYYHAPLPNANNGRGFYLSDAGQPFTRWQWADDVDGARISHNGWFTDEFEDQTIRGIVVRLPHGRLMVGWSMGEGMASTIEPGSFDDEIDAARMADEHARFAADEYQSEQGDNDE